MVRIAPVNLDYNPRTLWFDAGELEISSGDGVVVSTARGTEFGHMADEVFEADEEQIQKLKSPLKPVLRIASDQDEAQAQEMQQKSAEALPIFKEMAAETSDEMHPVSVEYLLDGDKAIFYFEAEERIDFRELVRKLAARFHVRVDMRQIGVRDEARMVGGLGHCGQELCCKRMGGEFCPVSIRMAKEQDLSLNPQKISGVCGRLMCCLRYEFEAYKDFKSRAPKQNAQIETPAGIAKVIDLDVPREIITLKVEGEKPVKVPLSEFDVPEEGKRPTSVSAEAWDEAVARMSIDIAGTTTSLLTGQLTGKDKLADPTSVRHINQSSQKQSSRSAQDTKSGTKKQESAPVHTARKPRRRRSTKVGGDTTTPQTTTQPRSSSTKQSDASQKNAQASQRRGNQDAQQKTNQQKSGGSIAKKRQGPLSKKQGNRPGAASRGKTQTPRDGRPSVQDRHAAGKDGRTAKDMRASISTRGGSKSVRDSAKSAREGAKPARDAKPTREGAKPARDAKQSPRPGQKSSGLRQAPRQERNDSFDAAGQNKNGGHRRPRRRSHKSGDTNTPGATGANGQD